VNTRLKKVFSSFQGHAEELIPVLQQVQEEFGFLSDDVMLEIARFTGVPESRVYGVATFYTQFRFSPIGKHHCMVCRGTACHVKGAPRILEELETKLDIKEGETSKDGEFSLETVACIGACGLAPTMVIDHKTYGRLTPKSAAEVIGKISADSKGEK
jgi:NADH-quinone oxidoreductase subunit E